MKRFLAAISAALSILIMAVSMLPASAATPRGSSALGIDPRKNYIIKPGQTITDKLNITNLDSVDALSLSLRMVDFTYSGQTGTPKMYLAANAQQTPWSLKPFTTLPKQVTVRPGATKTIKYSISMPKNEGAGSYYSAILYQAGGGTGGNVALNASGVTLVFVSVPGAVKENVALQKFGAYASDNNGVTGGYVFIATNGAPQMIADTVKNEGNVAEAPTGSIILKDMFGHTVNSINKTNANQSLALIGQTRLFTTCIQSKSSQIVQLGGVATQNTNGCVTPHLKPGRYTATLDLLYGQNGNQTHELTATAHFWYLPWWFLALVAIALAAIVLVIWWIQRKLRSIVKGTTYRSGRGASRRQ